MKTDKYYIEKYGGMLTGVLVGITVSFFSDNIFLSSIEGWKKITGHGVDFGIGIFGFLTTVLAIILQSSSKMISELKNRTVLFGRFVSFNKRVVIISLLFSLLSILSSFFDSNGQLNQIFIQKIFFSIYSFIGVWLIIDLYTYIRIFYLLVTDGK